MVTEEQIQAAGTKYIHVRADSAFNSVHHVHGVPDAVLQARAARAGAAPETSVRVTPKNIDYFIDVTLARCGFDRSDHAGLCGSIAVRFMMMDQFISDVTYLGSNFYFDNDLRVKTPSFVPDF